MSDNTGFPPPPGQPENRPDQPANQPGGQSSVPPVPPQYLGTEHQPANAAGGFPGAPQQPVGKGLAITALVLGIVAVVFSFLPFIGLPVGLAAVIVGIIGMTRKGAAKPMPLIGAILGGLGVIISIIVMIVAAMFISSLSGTASSAAAQYSSAVAGLETSGQTASNPVAQPSDPANSAAASSAAANGARTVKYVVTSSGPGKADYTTETGSSNAPVNGSWEKEVTMNGKFLITALTVSADDVLANTELSCEIFIDGKSVSKKTGTSLVICSGTGS